MLKTIIFFSSFYYVFENNALITNLMITVTANIATIHNTALIIIDLPVLTLSSSQAAVNILNAHHKPIIRATKYKKPVI